MGGRMTLPVLLAIDEDAEIRHYSESASLYSGRVSRLEKEIEDKNKIIQQLNSRLENIEQHIEQRKKMKARKFDGAEDIISNKAGHGCDNSTAKRPDSLDYRVHEKKGQEFHKERIYAMAEAEFKTALRLYPNPHTYLLLGSLYLQMGNVSKAEQSFNNALEMDQKNTAAYMQLGILLHNEGRYRQAEMVYKTALNYDGNNPALHNLLAVLYFSQGKNDMAKEEHRMAKQLKEGHMHINVYSKGERETNNEHWVVQ